MPAASPTCWRRGATSTRSCRSRTAWPKATGTAGRCRRVRWATACNWWATWRAHPAADRSAPRARRPESRARRDAFHALDPDHGHHAARCDPISAVAGQGGMDARALFFLTDPPTTEIYTLSLHDALPI